MKAALENIKKAALENLKACKDLAELDSVRVRFLGKKGELTAILKQMGSLSAEERPVIGQLANEVRTYIDTEIKEFDQKLRAQLQKAQLEAETIDVTIPGKRPELGKKHPLTLVLDEVKEIFLGMGFSVAEGPEVELDYYNFEALNIPKNHPARDTQDTCLLYTSDAADD